MFELIFLDTIPPEDEIARGHKCKASCGDVNVWNIS
jgi:hypothetical protein